MCIVVCGVWCECGVGGDSVWDVQVGGRDELISVLLGCDVVIYHITESQAQVEEGVWSAQGEIVHSALSVLLLHPLQLFTTSCPPSPVRRCSSVCPQ